MSAARLIQALSAVAHKLPHVEEVASEGDAQTRAFKTNNKAFLFLGVTTLRVKLETSLTEATKLAKHSPERFDVDAQGWVTVTFGEMPPPETLLRHWIGESHALMLKA